MRWNLQRRLESVGGSLVWNRRGDLSLTGIGSDAFGGVVASTSFVTGLPDRLSQLSEYLAVFLQRSAPF